MAMQTGLVSMELRDGAGVVKPYDQPFKYDDAVTTIANILAWVQGLAVKVDLITDAAIVKLRVSLLIPLPAGIKASATADSQVEATGLFTFVPTGTINAYGVDVPSIADAVLTGGRIDTTNANVTAFVAYLDTPATGISATDRYSNALASIRRAVLTFRKSRRALARH